jgi:DNA-binding HxlR family transcriptional regulator
MSRFQDAFEEVLRHRADRRILLTLASHKREIRYEALRKAIGEESPQLFKLAVDRLGRNALINRRLHPQGKRYMTFLSASTAGQHLGSVLLHWSKEAAVPARLPAKARREVRQLFEAPTLAA